MTLHEARYRLRELTWHVDDLRDTLVQHLTSIPMMRWASGIGFGLFLGVYTVFVASQSTKWVPVLLAPFFGLFFAMMVRRLRAMAIIGILFDIPLQFDKYVMYRDDVVARGSIGGFCLSVSTMALVVLYGMWISELITRRATLPKYIWRMSLPLAVYVIIDALSIVKAQDPLLSLFQINMHLQCFLMFFYLVGTVRTRKDILFLMAVTLSALTLEGILMVITRFTGEMSVAGFQLHVGKDNRIGGTVGSPIDAAGYVSLLLAPSLSLLATQLPKEYKWLGMVALFWGALGLMLTQSRAAYFSFILSCAILCVFTVKRGWLPITVPVLMVMGLGVMLILFQDTIMGRITGDDHGSADSRGPLMQLAWRAIHDNVWLGVGSNNYVFVLDRYYSPEFTLEWLYVVHSRYLLIWAETGIFALLAFLWFMIEGVYRSIMCWIHGDRMIASFGLAFTGALLGQMNHMIVDVFHQRPPVQMLWFIMAFITAMYQLSRNEKIEQHEQQRQEEREQKLLLLRDRKHKRQESLACQAPRFA